MQNSLTYNLGLKNDTDYQFVAKHTLEKRIELSNKYNNNQQVVVICEAHRLYKKQQASGNVIVPLLVFSKNDPVTSIFQALQGKLKIDSQSTLYLLCNNYLLQKEQKIGMIYEKYKNQQDGILYLKFCPQESFGN
ncbi:unnamed protein product [Paramecium sonneborni]|uniref:Autophagy-related protein n=1 Tax=Paramecium sonneborni TaxID=65129 RepID=A0A8S1RIF7_9CILI|nr:unnamed protein product [Paramecium sonneborni]